MERREFMLAAGGALACAGAAPAVALAALPPGLNRAAFAAIVGQSLIAYDSARGVALTLQGIRGGASSPGREQFTLQLVGDAGALRTGLYEVYHGSFGTVPLYLETAGDGGEYRIQFSLLG